jgi:hypothetical protein
MSPTARRMKAQTSNQQSTPPSTPSKSKSSSSTSNLSPPSPSTTKPPSAMSLPLPPHPPPSYLLLYPATLLVASAISLFSSSPLAQQPPITTSSVGGTAHIPTNPSPPYFSSKHNILNLYFVKILWFWVTLSFAAIVYRSPAFLGGVPISLAFSGPRMHRTIRALIRYALMTLAWILVTQWCFGPALIDRSFTLTGGACTLPTAQSASTPLAEQTVNPTIILNAATCKQNGGIWKGGHDISGHVFLLVLASAFLALELLGMKSVDATFHSQSANSNISLSMTSTAPKPSSPKPQATDEDSPPSSSTEPEPSNPWHIYLGWTVVVLCMWMLLMTGLYFHTLVEKISGLVISLGAIWGVYYVPRTSRIWREIVGIPGVFFR